MPRLLDDSLAALQEHWEEVRLAEAAASVAAFDRRVNRAASAILDGWLRRVTARGLKRISAARGRTQRLCAADASRDAILKEYRRTGVIGEYRADSKPSAARPRVGPGAERRGRVGAQGGTTGVLEVEADRGSKARIMTLQISGLAGETVRTARGAAGKRRLGRTISRLQRTTNPTRTTL